MTRMQLRCSPDQKERWERAAGGAGSLSAWIRDVLDREAAAITFMEQNELRVVEEGPDGKALGETPDEATAQVAPEGSSSTAGMIVQVDPEHNPDYVIGPRDEVPRLMTPEEREMFAAVEEEPVGTNGEAGSDPHPGEPEGSSSTAFLQDENGVNHLAGPNPGTQYTVCMLDAGNMTPVGINAEKVCDECLKNKREHADPLDIVVQRLFPGESVGSLMAEYEGHDHEFDDFLGWLTWRHERVEEGRKVVAPLEHFLTDTHKAARWYDDDALTDPVKLTDAEREAAARPEKPSVFDDGTPDHFQGNIAANIAGGYDPFDDTNPEPEDPVDLEPPRMLEADTPARPTLSPVCTNAAMHWRLVAGETCRYCGGTL